MDKISVGRDFTSKFITPPLKETAIGKQFTVHACGFLARSGVFWCHRYAVRAVCPSWDLVWILTFHLVTLLELFPVFYESADWLRIFGHGQPLGSHARCLGNRDDTIAVRVVEGVHCVRQVISHLVQGMPSSWGLLKVIMELVRHLLVVPQLAAEEFMELVLRDRTIPIAVHPLPNNLERLLDYFLAHFFRRFCWGKRRHWRPPSNGSRRHFLVRHRTRTLKCTSARSKVAKAMGNGPLPALLHLSCVGHRNHVRPPVRGRGRFHPLVRDACRTVIPHIGGLVNKAWGKKERLPRIQIKLVHRLPRRGLASDHSV
eukprot:m.87688 g.87688  ORF g.87688 m.87688 type:complete len:315 (-) comp11577_c0_seq1:723-1667(-)